MKCHGKDLIVLGISGSLRAASLNSRLLDATLSLAPASVIVDRFDGLRDVPPYDADLDTDEPPAPVEDLRCRIEAADGVVIATPEYNHSLPGVLKNALDWASRPDEASVLRNKPVAIIGAAPGNFGTARAQIALREVLHATHSIPLLRPEILMFKAEERFDGQALNDRASHELLMELWARFEELIYSRSALAVPVIGTEHGPATMPGCERGPSA